MAKKPIETCHLGSKYTLPHSEFMTDEKLYIHEHLETLYFIAKEFKCKTMVEIGTGIGASTLALAQAAGETDGHLTTFDIDQCLDAKDNIKYHKLEDYVTFLTTDSYSYSGKVDLLFIDGDHHKDAVKKDIIKFFNGNIKIGTWIIFHDTCNPKWMHDISQAMSECFINWESYSNPRKQRFVHYEWYNCNGLHVMRYDHDER